jgi:flap endonuclease-1
MAGRSIKITSEMTKDAKKLIRLMGVPVIEAPGEAEAQCAELVKLGLAYATASEDMDSLTFGSNVLLRGFNSKKEPIVQIELKP